MVRVLNQKIHQKSNKKVYYSQIQFANFLDPNFRQGKDQSNQQTDKNVRNGDFFSHNSLLSNPKTIKKGGRINTLEELSTPEEVFADGFMQTFGGDGFLEDLVDETQEEDTQIISQPVQAGGEGVPQFGISKNTIQMEDILEFLKDKRAGGISLSQDNLDCLLFYHKCIQGSSQENEVNLT